MLLAKTLSPGGFASGVEALFPVRSTDDDEEESTFCSRLVSAGSGAFVAGSTGPNEGGNGLSCCVVSSTDETTLSFVTVVEEETAPVFGLPKPNDPSEGVPRLKEIPVPPPTDDAELTGAVAAGRSNEKFGLARAPNVNPDWPLVPALPNENTGFVGALVVEEEVSVDVQAVINDPPDVEEAKLNGLAEEAAFEIGMFSLPLADDVMLTESFLSLSLSLLLGAAKLSPVLMLPPFGVGFIACSTAADRGVIVVCPKEKLPCGLGAAAVAWAPKENAFVLAVDVPSGLTGCCLGCCCWTTTRCCCCCCCCCFCNLVCSVSL